MELLVAIAVLVAFALGLWALLACADRLRDIRDGLAIRDKHRDKTLDRIAEASERAAGHLEWLRENREREG